MTRSSHTLKVGIDLGALLLEGRAPGTVKMVREQVRALLQLPAPWEWCLAIPSGKTLPVEPPAGSSVYELPGKKVSIFSTWTVGRLWDRLRCAAAFAPGTIAPICTAPIVANYFDSNIFEHGWTWIVSGRARGWIIQRGLAWFAFRSSQRLLINSEYCKSKLLNYRPDLADKLRVNYVGLSPPPPPPAHPPDWAQDLKGPFFLCAGSFSENKGQRRLLGAWRRLQTAFQDLPPLVLLGPCAPKYWKNAIRPALARLPRPEEIIYPGFVDERDLSWAYHHAIGYIQPSIAEGFSSFSVFESMFCDVPVACSNSTSHPEGTAGAARYFDPDHEEEMANAIRDIWQNQSLREDLIAKGRRRVEALSWGKNAMNVLTNLQDVIGYTA